MQPLEAAAADARKRVEKAVKALDGAKKALEKATAAASGGGAAGGEREFTVKNDKWVICSQCKAKVRNDSVDMKNHVCSGGGGAAGGGPDPQKIAGMESAVQSVRRSCLMLRV